MDLQEIRRKVLYQTGYAHGVYDQNCNRIQHMGEDFGILYLDGYKKGSTDAEKRKWYIAAIDESGKPKSWYIAGDECKSNNWAKTMEEATAFQTEQIASEHCMQLTNNVGRGNYSVIWR